MSRQCLLAKESLFSLRELSRKIKLRRTPHNLGVWCKDGLQSATGKQIKLEYVEIGGAYHSSIEAYERFIERLLEE